MLKGGGILKKVLVFGMTDNPGGVESFLMAYYRKLDRAKLQFDFLCNNATVAYEDEIKALEAEAAGEVAETSSAKSGAENFGGLSAAFDNAFANVEWQPGESN